MSNKISINFKNTILGFMALITFVCIIITFFLSFEHSYTPKDLLLYKIAGISFLFPIQIAFLLELNVLSLRKKVSLLNSTSFSKHIIFWILILITSSIFFAIPYSMITEDTKMNIKKSHQTTNTATSTTINKSIQSSSSPITTITNVESTNENVELTWDKLVEQKDRYQLTLTLLGNNFLSKTFTENKFAELNPSEKLLVKDLFKYYNENNKLPKEFSASFTKFCVGPEFDTKTFWGNENNKFYVSLANSFVISWKSNNTYYISVKQLQKEAPKSTDNYIMEEKPLTLEFGDKEYYVGNFTIKLRKIEIINKIARTTFTRQYEDPKQKDVNKSKLIGKTSYHKYFRIYATVTNNSSTVEHLRSTKHGFIIGQYYGPQRAEYIGFNNNYKWKVDQNIKASTGWYVPSKCTIDVCTSGLFTNDERFKYDDKPKFDLYFSSQDNLLTIHINQ